VDFKYLYGSESNFQLPTEDELKTVLDKVKRLFWGCKGLFWEAHSSEFNHNGGVGGKA
jgi:hypothetical protein